VKRAIVTGGAGFIGSHMVDLLLERGVQVRVVDDLATGTLDNLAHHRGHAGLTIRQVDMSTLGPDDPVFADADYVFHFGGIGDIVPSIERPLDYMRANVDGTLAMLEGSRRAGVKRFIYAASRPATASPRYRRRRRLRSRRSIRTRSASTWVRWPPCIGARCTACP